MYTSIPVTGPFIDHSPLSTRLTTRSMTTKPEERESSPGSTSHALTAAVPVVGEEEEEDDDYSVDDDEEDEEGGNGGKTNAQVLSEFYNVRARSICPETTSSLPGCLGHFELGKLTCGACAVAPT